MCCVCVCVGGEGSAGVEEGFGGKGGGVLRKRKENSPAFEKNAFSELTCKTATRRYCILYNVTTLVQQIHKDATHGLGKLYTRRIMP